MPGRQSTGAPLPRRSKTKNLKQKRSLNALAIAEQQNPAILKVRPNRLGVLEGNNTKRARHGEIDDLEHGDHIGSTKKRRIAGKYRFGNEVEAGSDSDGNQWLIGQVDSNDDSELNSDEAMGESDEEKVEHKKSRSISDVRLKRGIKRIPEKSNESRHEINLYENEGERQSHDDSDEFGGGGVDLEAMLDESDVDRGKPSKFVTQRIEGSSAFNRENEENYINEKEPLNEENSLLIDSEADDDIANSSRLTALQTFVTNIDKKNKNISNHCDPFNTAQESLKPSEFGLSSKRKLTLSDLTPSVTDPRLKRSLKLLADTESISPYKHHGIPKKLEVPLPKRQQDRFDRAAAYEKSKETLNRWVDTVKYNRRAEYLSFPLKDPNTVVAQGSQRLLSKIHSQPLTDLESTVQSILNDSGILSTEKDFDKNQEEAFKELPLKKISLQEVQARRIELRKAREILFREETRSKRIKKIKSKSYRRIHRKERERNSGLEKNAMAAAGIDNSESENERNDRRRAEERIGVRHRESKWARGIKESGKAAWDVDARGGVVEMARRREDLRRRIAGKEANSDGQSSDSSISESDAEADENQGQDLLKKNQRDLKILNGSDGDIGTRTSNLTSMKFMKNADAIRKKRNDAEAESLRREITGEESPSEKENEETVGRRWYGPTKGKQGPTKIVQGEQRGEFEEGHFSDATNQNLPGTLEENEQEIIVHDADTTTSKPSLKTSTRVLGSARKPRPGMNALQLDSVENPWLTNKNPRHKRKSEDVEAPVVISNSIPVKISDTLASESKLQRTLKSVHDRTDTSRIIKVAEKDNISQNIEIDGEDDEDDFSLPFVMHNQDLVRKAFAGDEVVAEFEKEKEEVTYEDEEKVVDNTLPGWGNWTGAGISKKQQKRNKGRVLIKEAGINRDKRQDSKLNRVIISEKRSKKVSGEMRIDYL